MRFREFFFTTNFVLIFANKEKSSDFSVKGNVDKHSIACIQCIFTIFSSIFLQKRKKKDKEIQKVQNKRKT